MLAALLHLVVVILSQDKLPTIDDLVEKIHAPRKAVTQYEIIIDAKQAQGKAWPHIRHIWKDGVRYRSDRLDDFT